MFRMKMLEEHLSSIHHYHMLSVFNLAVQGMQPVCVFVQLKLGGWLLVVQQTVGKKASSYIIERDVKASSLQGCLCRERLPLEWLVVYNASLSVFVPRMLSFLSSFLRLREPKSDSIFWDEGRVQSAILWAYLWWLMVQGQLGGVWLDGLMSVLCAEFWLLLLWPLTNIDWTDTSFFTYFQL